jgi:hypothetical protein
MCVDQVAYFRREKQEGWQDRRSDIEWRHRP